MIALDQFSVPQQLHTVGYSLPTKDCAVWCLFRNSLETHTARPQGYAKRASCSLVVLLAPQFGCKQRCAVLGRLKYCFHDPIRATRGCVVVPAVGQQPRRLELDHQLMAEIPISSSWPSLSVCLSDFAPCCQSQEGHTIMNENAISLCCRPRSSLLSKGCQPPYA